MINNHLKIRSILCGLILFLVASQTLATKTHTDPDLVKIIKSFDELRIDDTIDPNNDIVLPKRFITKFEDQETTRPLNMRIGTPVKNEMLSAATQNSSRIHKISNVALTASRKFAKMTSDKPEEGIKIVSHMRIPEDYCPNVELRPCDPYYKYRTIDGSCNNLANPWWGKSEIPFKRLLQPDYDDKFTAPKKKSVVHKKSLPSARAVANIIHASIDTNSPHSSYLMYFGQSIARDIASISPITDEIDDPKVCQCNTEDKDCFNIPLPFDEKHLSNLACLPFTRSSVSVGSFDCYLGAREQLNLATSFFDLEQVYGSNEADAEELRDVDGLLKFSISEPNKYVTYQIIDACPAGTKTGCLLTGDKRAEESNILTSVHTLWLREHNTLAVKLREVNPEWNDEKIFQEARKINIAQYQHIIYNEWLPVVLGHTIWKKYDLCPIKSGYAYNYNQKLSPNIANEFAAAAFRLHHLVNKIVAKGTPKMRAYEYADISTDLYNISTYVTSSDDVLRGTFLTHAYHPTPQINPTLNNRLYEAIGSFTSLGAINNQRGRDHGIPSYTRFRELCGLGKVDSFHDLDNIPKFVVEDFKRLYASVHDIDLYAGGVSELPVKGGLVGPTFACIIAKQFHDIKHGDRFWYENGDNRFTRFNLHQLEEIRKTSMARILCRNVATEFIPKNPFYKVNKIENPLVPCNHFKAFDFEPWFTNSTQSEEIDKLINNLVY